MKSIIVTAGAFAVGAVVAAGNDAGDAGASGARGRLRSVATASPIALRFGDDPVTVTFKEEAGAGTVNRNDVLREYQKLNTRQRFDTIQVLGQTLHISAEDLHADLSYEEAKTEAFILAGHLVQENESVTYVLTCPACPEGGCEDAVCTFSGTEEDNEDDALEVAHEVFTEKQEGADVTAPRRKLLPRGTCYTTSDCQTDQKCDWPDNDGGICYDCHPSGGTGCKCSNSADCVKNCVNRRCTNTTPCFSSKSTAIVKGKGVTPVKDLRIGDMVLSDAHGTYSTFYSKGHYNEHTSTEFLQIATEATKHPLEATQDHMVFTATCALPIPASAIKVGEVVRTIHGPAKVTAVKKITRKGLYSPVTLSGTIIIDGVVASANVQVAGFEGAEPGWVYLGDAKVVHWHTLVHAALAPHRLFCGRLAACSEPLDDEGFTPYHHFLLGLAQKAAEKQSSLYSAFVLLAVGLVMAPFYAVDLLIENAFVVLAGGCVAGGIWRVLSDTKVKVKSA